MASGATSIWGRPYPLSSDAPAVHSDLQALANSLETVPTYPTTATTSRTGVSGESVAVSPSQTLTLPAAPVKGDRIQILALGTVTGATPVTVAGGGKTINGLGLSAASSFLLGTPNANATAQYDGSAWRIIDGQQDTGWVVLTLTTGIVSGGGYVPAARTVGDEVRLRGILQNTSGGALTSPMTVPVASRPASLVAATGATLASGVGVTLSIAASGASTVSAGGIPNGSSLGLDNMRYSLL